MPIPYRRSLKAAPEDLARVDGTADRSMKGDDVALDRQRLRARYLRLGTGEFAAAVVFAAVGVQVAPGLEELGDWALWAALTPLIIVLVQAGGFWLLARSWVRRATMSTVLAKVYVGFGVCDVLLLLGGLIGVVAWAPNQWWLLGFMLVWLFGLVEFVNYFVVRLAYPARTWHTRVGNWRRPQLMVDVRRALARG